MCAVLGSEVKRLKQIWRFPKYSYCRSCLPLHATLVRFRIYFAYFQNSSWNSKMQIHRHVDVCKRNKFFWAANCSSDFCLVESWPCGVSQTAKYIVEKLKLVSKSSPFTLFSQSCSVMFSASRRLLQPRGTLSRIGQKFGFITFKEDNLEKNALVPGAIPELVNRTLHISDAPPHSFFVVVFF